MNVGQLRALLARIPESCDGYAVVVPYSQVNVGAVCVLTYTPDDDDEWDRGALVFSPVPCDPDPSIGLDVFRPVNPLIG